MWARVVMAILGLWMMVVPDVLKFEKNIADNAHVVGPLVLSLSIISLWECTRNVRLLNGPLALWLMAAPLIFQYDNDTAFMNDYLVAITIVLLLLIRPARRHRFAGGWLSLLRRHHAER